VDDSVSSEAELVRTLKGHVTTVTSLAFSPSALLLVSGCCKGWMNVWALQVHLSFLCDHQAENSVRACVSLYRN